NHVESVQLRDLHVETRLGDIGHLSLDRARKRKPVLQDRDMVRSGTVEISQQADEQASGYRPESYANVGSHPGQSFPNARPCTTRMALQIGSLTPNRQDGTKLMSGCAANFRPGR